MRSFKVILVSLVLVAGGFVLISCATRSLDRAQKAQIDLASAEDQAATDASRVGDAVASNLHHQAAEAARARVLELETKRAAAKAADDAAWTGGINGAGSLANLFLPGASAVVAVIGTLLTQRLRGTTFADGQVSGATVATTAITTADTSNSLQDPRVKTDINAALAVAPPHITNAVNAAI